jgi:hypothetical protein
MANKAKKLGLYGRVLDVDQENTTASLHHNSQKQIPGRKTGMEAVDDNEIADDEIGALAVVTDGDWAERESVVSGVTASVKGGALVPRKSHQQLLVAASSRTVANPQEADALGLQADEAYFLHAAFVDIHDRDIAEALRALRYAGDLPLSQLVHRLAYQIDTRLLQLLDLRFHFKQHLAALKRFLLLGQGDFVMCLMDGIAPELKKRANTLFRHNLTAILEGALRASNAQYDPTYILDRVHVRLLDAAPGDTGWDIFALDYHTQDMPLHAIVHPEAMRAYRLAFHMLWRLKRVEWSLTTTWKSFLSFAHSHEWKMHTLSSSKVAKLPSFLAIKSIFHRCNLQRAKMMHFVNNFAAFVMFEVLEHSWVQLQDALHRAQSLDQVIDAHDRYLMEILDRALLSPRHEKLHMMMQAVLQSILRFCSLEETLVADAMALVARQKMLRNSAAAEDADATLTADGISNTLILRIDETVRDYNAQFDDLMTSLKDEAEKSHDFLRYLTFRLDFNNFGPTTGTASSATPFASTANVPSDGAAVDRRSLVSSSSSSSTTTTRQQSSLSQSQQSVRPGSAVAVIASHLTQK